MELKPKNRILHLAKQVDQDSVNAIIKEILDITQDDNQLMKLAKVSDLIYAPKPIQLYIDSYGGEAYSAMGLVSVIDRSKIPIHTIVVGCAMSAAFWISISGHKRFCYPQSTFMYHQVSTGFHGKVKDTQDDLVETVRIQKIMEDYVLKKTEITQDQLRRCYDAKKDWYIDSEEALKLKIIEEII